jgi:hypothetical protein
MSALNALFFAGMIAGSLIELVDYVANPRANHDDRRL